MREPTPLELKAQIEELRREMEKLRGSVKELTTRAEEAEQTIDKIISHINTELGGRFGPQSRARPTPGQLASESPSFGGCSRALASMT